MDPNSTHDAPDGIGVEPNRESRTSKFRRDLSAFYARNFGLFLVFVAQTCGSVVRFPFPPFPSPFSTPPPPPCP